VVVSAASLLLPPMSYGWWLRLDCWQTHPAYAASVAHLEEEELQTRVGRRRLATRRSRIGCCQVLATGCSYDRPRYRLSETGPKGL
jgi:hypothetical protein